MHERNESIELPATTRTWRSNPQTASALMETIDTAARSERTMMEPDKDQFPRMHAPPTAAGGVRLNGSGFEAAVAMRIMGRFP